MGGEKDGELDALMHVSKLKGYPSFFCGSVGTLTEV